MRKCSAICAKVRLAAPVLLIAPLFFPLDMTQAQQRNPGQLLATQQVQTTESTRSIASHRISTDKTRSAGHGIRGTQGQLGTATTTKGHHAQEGKKKVTVVRRVRQATAPASIIKQLQSQALARATVTIQRNRVKPRQGSSMFLLSNGGYLVIRKKELLPPEVMQEFDIFLKPDGSWLLKGCMCLGENQDDCRIDSAVQKTCYTEGNDNCCAWVEITLEP